jgi:hypothetical protein
LAVGRGRAAARRGGRDFARTDEVLRVERLGLAARVPAVRRDRGVRRRAARAARFGARVLRREAGDRRAARFAGFLAAIGLSRVGG